ncbi:3-phosphoshikimate 1-carboxyvinyltransferase [Rhynchospora pubera]|uniref:3-phosphoshikimate 1-carboxyvinyltransferase n=1 Tax=Rhynchospora pubera TaxID=906938 RepID=A0AAV8GGJ4_9POAL|nr:3-phosphoshikimate 1-carboxyvinyltransferase [Rhynchospora pubera]
MGNSLSPCCYCPSPMSARIVFWGGSSKSIQGRCQAGDLMRELPGHVVCHGDSFYIGLPIPVLSIDDELLPGQTYFVLPVDRLSFDQALTAASLSYLSPDPNVKPSLVGIGPCPFEHVKNEDGSILIRILPEFVERVIGSGSGKNVKCGVDGGLLCNTPELKKHYAQLVGPRDRQWSPRLETIKENSKHNERLARRTPAKLFGFQSIKSR